MVKNWLQARNAVDATDKGNFECFVGLSGSESSPAAIRPMSVIKTNEASAAWCQQSKEFPHTTCFQVSPIHSRHPYLALHLRETSPLQVTWFRTEAPVSHRAQATVSFS